MQEVGSSKAGKLRGSMIIEEFASNLFMSISLMLYVCGVFKGTAAVVPVHDIKLATLDIVL